MSNPHERRVLAALGVLGWPDDRDGSAHVEEDGHEVTPTGHYWSIVEDVLRAADAAGLHQNGSVGRG